MSPADRRKVVQYLLDEHRVSERQACRIAGLSRAAWRYRTRRKEPEGLRERLVELAVQRPRYGYRRLHAALRTEGFLVNHKLVYRLYREEGLSTRAPQRTQAEKTAPSSH